MDNLVEIISGIFGEGGIGNYIGLAAVLILVISVVLQALHGFLKGYKSQTLKTVFTVLAATLAFIIVNSTCNSVFDLLGDTTAHELIESIENGMSADIPAEMKDIMLEIDPLILEYLLAVIFSPLFAPFLFLFIFLAFNAVFRILYHIIKWVCRLRGGGLTSRLIGIFVGALHGLIFALIVILPFTVITDSLDTVVKAEIEAKNDGELEELYETAISPVTNHKVFKTVKLLGGDMILDAFGNVKNGETEFNARDEYYVILNGALTGFSEFNEIKFNELTEKDKETVYSLLETVDNSDFLSVLFAEILHSGADGLKDKIATGNIDVDEVITAVTDIFKTTDKNTVCNDVKSMVDILFVLSDCGFMSADENADFAKMLTEKDENGKSVVDKVREITRGNSRLLPIETALVKAAISNMPGESTASGAESYESVKNGFNDILAIEKADPEDEAAYGEYVSSISSTIGASLEKEGITLEKETVDDIALKVAEYIDENIEDGSTELSEEQFNDLILNNYELFLEYTASK